MQYNYIRNNQLWTTEGKECPSVNLEPLLKLHNCLWLRLCKSKDDQQKAGQGKKLNSIDFKSESFYPTTHELRT